MFGQHEDFGAKILETSTCHIGIRNPDFRISDERFCKTPLETSNPASLRKFSQGIVVNFFIIGFSKVIV